MVDVCVEMLEIVLPRCWLGRAVRNEQAIEQASRRCAGRLDDSATAQVDVEMLEIVGARVWPGAPHRSV